MEQEEAMIAADYFRHQLQGEAGPADPHDHRSDMTHGLGIPHDQLGAFAEVKICPMTFHSVARLTITYDDRRKT
jgi:hypothetical protein